MNISQVQFAFVAEQEAVRAWFTRRLVKLLWPNLMRMVAKRVVDEKPAATPEARQMILGMKREAHLQQMDFSKPFRGDAASYPLGQEPLLVARVDMAAQPHGVTRMSLKRQDGHGFDLNLNEGMFDAFCQLLRQACLQAEWGIELRLPGQGEGAPPADTPRLLN
jgi:hypothetical protein